MAHGQAEKRSDLESEVKMRLDFLHGTVAQLVEQ